MSKKGLVELTIDQKNQLSQYADKNKHLSRAQLVDWLKVTFKREIHPSTVTRILQKFSKETIQPTAGPSSKRVKQVSHPELRSN